MACVGNRRCCCCVAIGVKTLLEWSGTRDFAAARDLTAYTGWDSRLEANCKRSQFWRIVFDDDDEVYAMGAIRNGRMYRIWEQDTLRLGVDLGQGQTGTRAGFIGIDGDGNDNLWYWHGAANLIDYDFRLEVGTSRCGCGKSVWPDGCSPQNADELRYVYYEGDAYDPLIESTRCPPEVLFYRHQKYIDTIGGSYLPRFETASGTFGRRVTTRIEYTAHPADRNTEHIEDSLFDTAKCVIVSRQSGYNQTWSGAAALKAWLETGNKVLVIDALNPIPIPPSPFLDANLDPLNNEYWGVSASRLRSNAGSLANTTTFWSDIGITTTAEHFEPETDFPPVVGIPAWTLPSPEGPYTVAVQKDSWFNILGYGGTDRAGSPSPVFTYSNASVGPAMEGVTINWSASTLSGNSLYTHYKLTPGTGAETLANLDFSLYEQTNQGGPWPTGNYGPFPGVVLERVGDSYVILVAGLDHHTGSGSEFYSTSSDRVGFAVSLPDRLLQNVIAMAEAL